MIVLGIDGGLANCGIAVIEFIGFEERIRLSKVIRTEKSSRKANVRASDDSVRRAQELSQQLNEIIVAYRPAVMCVESMSFPRNSSNASKMGIAWGVIASLGQHHTLPIVQASPQDAKKAVCSRKDASKDDVCMAIELRFPDIDWPPQKGLMEHVADAAAVVVACLDSQVLRTARRLSQEVA